MRKSYPDFVGQFDTLVDADVRWTPFTTADIYTRALSGLSSLCLRDQEYWMTRKRSYDQNCDSRGHPTKMGSSAETFVTPVQRPL